MADLSEQLAAAIPSAAHLLVFRARGSVHPPFNGLSVQETLVKFTEEMLPLSPLKAPHGKRIKIIRTNFPKLAGLKHKTLSRDEFSASSIISEIEEGTFDIGNYQPNRDDRLRTLFWLPEVLTDPDAIYSNAHKIVAGDQVYVRVYDKMGSTVKLAFTKDVRKREVVIQTVLITSFLTDPKTAMGYVRGQPIYQRPEKK